MAGYGCGGGGEQWPGPGTGEVRGHGDQRVAVPGVVRHHVAVARGAVRTLDTCRRVVRVAVRHVDTRTHLATAAQQMQGHLAAGTCCTQTRVSIASRRGIVLVPGHCYLLRLPFNPDMSVCCVADLKYELVGRGLVAAAIWVPANLLVLTSFLVGVFLVFSLFFNFNLDFDRVLFFTWLD